MIHININFDWLDLVGLGVLAMVVVLGGIIGGIMAWDRVRAWWFRRKND